MAMGVQSLLTHLLETRTRSAGPQAELSHHKAEQIKKW